MFQRHLLSDADVEPLADGVYTVLEKVGVACQNAELLDALAAAGAQVDRAAERVRFPRKMQAEFIEHVRTQTAGAGDGRSRTIPTPEPAGTGPTSWTAIVCRRGKRRRPAPRLPGVP